MTITSMTSFKEVQEKKIAELVKLRNKSRFRHLSTDKPRMAMYDYRCDNCIMSIRPGDEYVREVWVNYKYMRIKRRHWPECYGPTEEEDRRMREEIDREREAEREVERKVA